MDIPIFVGADADGPARLTKLENDGWSKNVENGEGKVNDTEASSADVTYEHGDKQRFRIEKTKYLIT